MEENDLQTTNTKPEEINRTAILNQKRIITFAARYMRPFNRILIGFVAITIILYGLSFAVRSTSEKLYTDFGVAAFICGMFLFIWWFGNYSTKRKCFNRIRKTIPTGNYTLKRVKLLCKGSLYYFMSFQSRYYYLDNGYRTELKNPWRVNASPLVPLGSEEAYKNIHRHGIPVSIQSGWCRKSEEYYYLVSINSEPCMIIPESEFLKE